MFKPKVRCPAGFAIFEGPQGTACRCRIEENTLTAAADPSSLDAFCFDRYDLCTSWQAQKEFEATGQMSGSVLDDRPPEQSEFRSDLVEPTEEAEVVYYEAPE